MLTEFLINNNAYSKGNNKLNNKINSDINL